jgi:hypothetical protein
VVWLKYFVYLVDKIKIMLEQITTDMDVQMPGGGKKKPNKLASMKKKYVKGVEVMDTELRSNVPVSKLKKEDKEFVKYMEAARPKG